MPPRADRPNPTRIPIAAVLLAGIAALSIPLLMLLADRPVALAMEELPPWFRNLAGDITWIGKSLGWLLLSAGLALFWTWRSHRSDPAGSHPSLYRRRALASAFLFSAVALSGIIANLIKLAVGRLRPNLFLGDGSYGFEPWHLDADLRGFPSGHTTTMFALAFAIAVIRPGWRLSAFAAAIVISATRIIINAHYLSDVIGGMVVALVTVLWLRRIFEQRGWLAMEHRPRPESSG
jgi:membrane-associated phospholipid phosphatase